MIGEHELRRLALGSLLLGFRGPVVPAWVAEALRHGLGGVVLFGSNMVDRAQLSALTDELRAVAGGPLAIAVDEEGGDVTRLDLPRGSESPGAAAPGHLDDPQVTEAVYRHLGARLVDVGVTANLAPVADVNSDPRNPVIGVRSFGDEPALVSRHVAAAVRGIQSTGIAAVVKHFPGHGATSEDSHHSVPTIDRSRSELGQVELAPFRAAIATGTRAIMTGHLLVPAFDRRLATISPAITSGLLREELGFTGAIVTDALEMRALSSQVGLADAVVAALIAGADAIETGAGEYPELVKTVPDAVVQAVAGGHLSAGRVAAAALATVGLARAAVPAPLNAIPADVAAQCLEIIGSIPTMERPLVIECRTTNGVATGELEWSLATRLAARVPGTDIVIADGLIDLPRVEGRSLVVVIRDPLRNRWQDETIAAARRHPASIVVDVGWPATLPADVNVLRTRGIAPGLLEAAAQLLAGDRSGSS